MDDTGRIVKEVKVASEPAALLKVLGTPPTASSGSDWKPGRDAQAARLLIEGEALPAPAGRADDFAWPRREIGREGAKAETPVASTSLDSDARVPAASPQPKKHRR